MGASRVESEGLLTRRGRHGNPGFSLSSGLIVMVLAGALVASCAQTSGTARGVVVTVEGTIDDVTSFTVLSAGEELEFVPVPGADYGFPLSHLREHQRTGDPVLVEWELVGSVRQALSVADG